MLYSFPVKIISFSAYLLIPFSVLAFKSLYACYLELSNEYEEAELFKKRHNCVVMFRDNMFTGWPPYNEREKNSVAKRLEELYEPLLYFVHTAKNSLDMAFMLINIKPVFKALTDAHSRGVKVRLLLNFSHCESVKADLRTLKKEGNVIGISIILPNLNNFQALKF